MSNVYFTLRVFEDKLLPTFFLLKPFAVAVFVCVLDQSGVIGLCGCVCVAAGFNAL